MLFFLRSKDILEADQQGKYLVTVTAKNGNLSTDETLQVTVMTQIYTWSKETRIKLESKTYEQYLEIGFVVIIYFDLFGTKYKYISVLALTSAVLLFNQHGDSMYIHGSKANDDKI